MGGPSGSAHPNLPRSKSIGAATLLALMAGSILYACCISLRQTGGHFTYGLDDPYIHLGIAKNFAYHGVWGVTQYANASASSSPLWTLLLAASIRFGGNWVMWPFVLGVLFSVLTTLTIYRTLLKRGLSIPGGIVASIAVFWVGPLHILPFTGMEHSLQCFLDISFLFWLLDLFGRRAERNDYSMAVLLPALMCLARYESVFLLSIPILITLIRREWKLATCLVLGPIVGIGGFGALSHLMGMPPIPNSILLKGNLPHTTLAGYLQGIFIRIQGMLVSHSLTMSELFVGVTILGFALRSKAIKATSGPLRSLVWTVVTVCILHAAFASFGWFYRYEAYLLVLLTTTVVLVAHEIEGLFRSMPGVIGSRRTGIAVVAALVATQLWLLLLYGVGDGVAVAFALCASFGCVCFAITMWGRSTCGWIQQGLPVAFTAIFLLATFDRGVLATEKVPFATRDIYTQQLQMSRFVQRYYPNGKIAVNDIGAVTYFSQAHLLDLFGLATDSIRRSKLKHEFNTPAIRQQLNDFQPDVIMVYKSWFPGTMKLPK